MDNGMYRVQLQQFEGPLDLLLFFIRRDELDIYDIPIAQIADEFFNWVRVLEEIDLDGVGEFIYMAALLINIKARMLLPSPELDEEGEPIDPRRELVERLLEYIRFKEASEMIGARQEDRASRFTRRAPAEVEQYDGEEVLFESSIFDLISGLRRVLSLAPESPVHVVSTEEYSIEEQQAYLIVHLVPGVRTSFATLMSGNSKAFIVATFLAVLELTRNGIVALFIATTEDFFLKRMEMDGDEESAYQNVEQPV